jgi:hypothetical protein
LRVALALLFIVHGIAHLPGFAVAWRLTHASEMPYKTTLLNGSLNVGNAGIRIVGILWLLAGIGFVLTAVVTFRGQPAWPQATLYVTLFSLVLCGLAWPDSRIGLMVDLAILALLFAGLRLRWF